VRDVFGPQLGFRETLGGVFDDRKGIPDRDVAIDQRRHFPGRRDIEKSLLVSRAGIERDQHFLERDAGALESNPWAHRPRRVVLVTDHQLQSHHPLPCEACKMPCARQHCNQVGHSQRLPPAG